MPKQLSSFILFFILWVPWASAALPGREEFQKNFVRDVTELALIESPTVNDKGISQIGEILNYKLKALGFISNWNFETRSVTASKISNTAKKTVLLVGHFDTVFDEKLSLKEVKVLRDAKLLSQYPKSFAPILSGPGVADAKGGIVLLLELLKSYQNDPDISFKIFLSGDEEKGSKFSKMALQEFAKGVDLALCYEPGWFDLDKNKAMIPKSVGGNATLTFSIQTEGGHAGIKSDRLNAIVVFSEITLRLRHYHSDEMPVTPIMLKAESLRNVSAPEATLAVSVRYETAKDFEKILNELTSIQKKYPSVTVVKKDIWLPHALTSQPLVNLLNQAARSLEQPAIHTAISLPRGQSSFLAEVKIPVIDSMGPQGTGIHSLDEVVYVGSVYDRLLLNFHLIKMLKTYLK